MPDTSDARVAGPSFGRFTIEGELGAGGMGRVYRAHDPTLNRPVAIKVLRDASVTARDRLSAEARSASGLNHPNICTIYEIGEVGGVPFIAMELVVGQPLSSLVTTAGLSADVVKRLGLQVTVALAHAHQYGVVHGDLKPQNVIVTPAGSAKLLDFGLARRLDAASVESLTRAGTAAVGDEIAGTLPYMAPEMLRGAPPSASTDVWALGVLLHEMAAGKRPFFGSTAFELAEAIPNGSPAPLPASVSPAFAAFVAKCLEKDPAARYSSARDALLALETAAVGVVTRRDRTGDGLQLRRRAIGFAALAALALLGAYLWLGRTAGPGATPAAIASLIVLPFDNLSRDASEDYFSNGMTDALITDLSRLPNLKVISRTSSARYKALGKSSQAIGRELGVEAIVDGSVLRADDQVRIFCAPGQRRDRPRFVGAGLQAQVAGRALAAGRRRPSDRE